MRGVFVDANESLAVIFERLEKPGDPKVLIHRNPDITSDQYPAHTRWRRDRDRRSHGAADRYCKESAPD